ncbi:MAG: excinuclease ABC subunit UvrA [Eubacteriales bacterium]|nr:excinuclease ABC subunit UvrA [Christensenellaceae bacterium]MDD6938785.1 excinuclease ABC subunit UvrA [Christensenellaceae bacterium]MDY2747316.1 excinuclease ABC subunit UvrA [Eubacteriales bacterium]MDY4696147.1 excinuclease ABC subunit UvrA [Eubacteriales bacterium]
MRDEIVIRGAREHNLKNLNLTIPRDKLIVFTGLSGSGKSSLAFDTIYAEGQRRYVESLSSYARQFLGQMEKPDVDTIEGLSPAISIDQKSTSNNPRSTVGTVTEIHDYLRLLYARIGIPHCPKCGRVIRRQTVDEVVEQVMAFGEGARVQIIAPAVRGRKGEHVKLLEQIQKDGYVRVKVDGEIYDIADVPKLDKKLKHTIDVIVDRIVVRAGAESRLAGSLETAFAFGAGLAKVEHNGEEQLFSENYACPDCGVSIEELTPRMFSFNNPYGACPTCSGLGALMKIDPALIVPNEELSLRQGAINVTGWQSSNTASIAGMYLAALGDKYGFDMDTPFNKLSEQARHAILYGTGNERIHIEYRREFGEGSYDSPFEGVIPNLERRYKETQSDYMKHEIEEYMANIPCPDCKGKRLKSESLAVTVGGMNIAQLSDMTVRHAREKLSALTLNKTEEMIAGRILKEIDSRLGFLISVGLDYLTLSRAAGTLSGGEAQRIRLATQIGSSLVGVLYILDEPSIGLHQRDNAKLIDTLKGMRDIGNTLIVVEHDEETMLNADYIVDIGPGPGEHGGEVVFAGTPEEIMTDEKSITGKYLSGREYIAVPARRRETGENWLQIRGARANNLKNVNVDIPLGVFTCVTGVSGSGKSSLVNEVLKKTLLRDLNRARTRPGEHDEILGIDKLDKIIDIDQSPIGRTPRSNPATYTGLFDLIRDVFAQTPDAKMRGYTNGRFSFNVKGGRCEACRGDGILKIEMHFLPDIYVPCEVCGGKRYNRETLEVKYKGKTIADVLDMTVEEALKFFAPLPKLARKLQTLYDVGLGYIRLGQSSTTLSGGEAQRVKLATELARRDTGRTLYVLDEPTTGLHTDDVKRLIAILQRLCDGGSTVVVIEHNLDVIKTADYIIDLGPEGGDMGGTIVCTGTPEQVAQNKKSYTGIYLKPMLEKGIRE